MSQTFLLRGAKQLLTLRGVPNVRRGADFADLAVIKDGSILIRDGKIASVGSTRRLENLQEARKAIEIPVHGSVVMPGFVDPCIQLSLFDSDKKGAPKRKRLSEFYEDSIALMRSCLQHGTLTAGVKAFSGNGVRGSDLAVLRQLARIGNNPVEMVRAWQLSFLGEADRPVANALEALTPIRKQKLAAMLNVPGHLDPDANAELLATMAQAQMPVGLSWGGGDAERLRALIEATAASKVLCQTELSLEERKVLAESAAAAIFTTGHRLLEDQPGGSLSDLAEAGGAIALASGYGLEGETNFNMQWVVALAVMRLRLSVEQALVATTINAAYAVNCGHQVGSLEVNKRADILVLNLDDYHELPRRLGINNVGMVIRNGVVVMNRTRWRVGAA